MKNAYLIGAAVLAHRPEEAEDAFDLLSDEQVGVRVAEEMERTEPVCTGFDGPALQPYELEEERRVLQSCLPDVSDEAWTEFVLACKVQDPDDVSPYGEVGMFALKPRRLEDLGLMENLKKMGKRWTGDWVEGLSEKLFLASPAAQYEAFCASMRLYVEGIDSGAIEQPDDVPEEMTLSGALAILHRWGPHGLVAHSKDNHFPQTQKLYAVCNGLF